ncbi:MAG: TauD/TfdA family dioxygenase [Proteobacteria bacterium]|nr:TauD/TfdA family dioxygenase [Pseudomonadota bacterium]MBI3495952.1 TauD/TfdA family dioxygenase [Pseudomonadota bacterium]
MLTHAISGKQAWIAATLAPADWIVPIPHDCQAELVRALAEIRAHPLPMLLLTPDEFRLDACRLLMRRVRALLDDGAMFAVVDRLPVEEMSLEESTSLYWLLSSLLARPVAQKLDGTMTYLVSDTGATLKPGSGIRPTVTNVELNFHNDNSYNETPPEIVALLCHSQAKEGGQSRVVSVYSVHNRLLETAPGLLPRLYRPFWYDRHREFFEGEANTFAAPIFAHDARLTARLALLEIRGGYQLRGEAMDGETKAALDAVESVLAQPDLPVTLRFVPGQIQYVNNRSTGHSRTAFLDGELPGEKRLLVRLWLRNAGRRSYRG